MGKSKQSIKLYVEFNGLKLVYAAKKGMVIGRMLKKLERRFQDNFDLEDTPKFDKVFEKGYLVSQFDTVEEVFEDNAEIELLSTAGSSNAHLHHHPSSDISIKPKRDIIKEKDTKPKEKFLNNSIEIQIEKTKPSEKDPKLFSLTKKLEDSKKEELKREDPKKEESKKIEVNKKEEQTKDSKLDSASKKLKRHEIREPAVKFLKLDEDRKPIPNDPSKKDPLKTSSSSESDSDIFTKEERKPMLSKSNIFRP